MVTNELLDYIKEARGKSLDDKTINSQLQGIGWSESDIKSGILALDSNLPLPPAPNSTAEKSAGTSHPAGNMWDAFQHALMFISLYVFASSLALILHYFVDDYLPGVQLDNYSYLGNMQSTFIIGYLSAFMVSFPLFAFFFLKITKQTLTTPQIRNLRSRKILIYLTLIATFIIMMCNVIATLYGFLSGNVSVNFVLHFVVTVGISGIVFAYYLNEVKEDRRYV